MKAVMLSIRPEWCKKIALGLKTIEVHKTKPKIETPFKCYIYCTLSGSKEFFQKTLGGDVAKWNRGKWFEKKGRVIGEFVCDAVFPICVSYSDPNNRIALMEFPFTCLSDKQIMDYLGNGRTGYGWHISDLVIYDRPKDLSEFHVEDNRTLDCPQLISMKRPPQSWRYVED